MEYRCVATSVEGFIQILACNYLPAGYWWYVTGRVKKGLSPAELDRRLIEKFGVDVSRTSRARRKQMGVANLQYLRYDEFWVLLATKGRSVFYEIHGKQAEGDEGPASVVKDIRDYPLFFHGYSLTVKRGQFLKRSGAGDVSPDGRYRSRVQIRRETFNELLAYFEDRARQNAEVLAKELFSLPFEPYAPVRKQSLNILWRVNKARQAAGLRPLPTKVLRYRRRIVRPFDIHSRDEEAADCDNDSPARRLSVTDGR